MILPDFALDSGLSMQCLFLESIDELKRFGFLCDSCLISLFTCRGRIGISIACRDVSSTQIKFKATSASASSKSVSRHKNITDYFKKNWEKIEKNCFEQQLSGNLNNCVNDFLTKRDANNFFLYKPSAIGNKPLSVFFFGVSEMSQFLVSCFWFSLVDFLTGVDRLMTFILLLSFSL